MQIQFSSPALLIVELSGSDMAALDLTYDRLDFADPRTRALLTDFLLQYGVPGGFPLHPSRTVVEIFPTAKSGCVIFFSAPHEPSKASRQPLRLRRVRHEPYVFEFDSAEDMMSAVCAVRSSAELRSGGELYRFGRLYRMIFRGIRPSSPPLLTLSEFGRLIGHGASAAAHTAEHGRLLSRDALSELGRFLA